MRHLKQRNKPESPKNINVRTIVIIMHIFWLFSYVLSCYNTQNTESAYLMVASIRTLFEGRPMDYNGKAYDKIVTKYDIDLFINDIILDQIYEESLKEFPAMVEGYHYVKYYNYFAGMRLT